MNTLHDLSKDLSYVLRYYYPYLIKVWKQPGDKIYVRKKNNNHTGENLTKFEMSRYYTYHPGQSIRSLAERWAFSTGYCKTTYPENIMMKDPFTFYNLIIFILSH